MTQKHEIPAAAPRNPLWKRAGGLVVLIAGVVFVTWCFMHFGKEWSPRRELVTVRFSEVHGVHVGSIVELRRGKIGEVVGAVHDGVDPEAPWTLTLSVEPQLAERIRKESTRFSISRPGMRGLDMRGERNLIGGSTVVIWLGSEDAPAKSEFVGLRAQPQLGELGVEFSVRWTEASGVEIGTPVAEINGRKIGEVVSLGKTQQDGSFSTGIILERDDDLEARVCVETSVFSVQKLRVDKLNIKGEDRIVNGAVIVVHPGTRGGKKCLEFVGSRHAPLDSRITAKSLRKEIGFGDAWGIAIGSNAWHNGRAIGQVETVDWDDKAGEVVVRVAFFEGEPKMYLGQGVRWYAERPEVSLKSPHVVQGDLSAAVMGTKLIAVIDPYLEDASTDGRVKGRASTRPRYTPQAGEKPLLLGSDRDVEPDTPIVIDSALVGYVNQSWKAPNGQGSYVEARIYPDSQHFFGEGTVIYFAPKYSAQLFKWNGWGDVQGPKFEIPDERRLLQTVIECKIIGSRGVPFKFAKHDTPRYRLWPEPKEEWLKAPAATVPAPITADPKLPPFNRADIKPVGVALEFYYKGGITNWRPAKHRFDGRGLVVDGGVIALRELLEPMYKGAAALEKDLNQSRFVFTVANSNRERVAPPLACPGHEIRYMKTDLKGAPTTPSSVLACVKDPVDVRFLLDQKEDNDRGANALQLTPDGGRWKVSAETGFKRDWNGATVVCMSPGPAYGKVIGFLRADDRNAEVYLLTADFAAQLKNWPPK